MKQCIYDEIDIDLYYLFNEEKAEKMVRLNAKQILDDVIRNTFPEVIYRDKQKI